MSSGVEALEIAAPRYQFKRRWGMVPVTDPLSHVAAVRVTSPVVRQAFAMEPVLIEEQQGLRRYAGE